VFPRQRRDGRFYTKRFLLSCAINYLSQIVAETLQPTSQGRTVIRLPHRRARCGRRSMRRPAPRRGRGSSAPRSRGTEAERTVGRRAPQDRLRHSGASVSLYATCTRLVVLKVANPEEAEITFLICIGALLTSLIRFSKAQSPLIYPWNKPPSSNRPRNRACCCICRHGQ
jgi:hypothetical protein